MTPRLLAITVAAALAVACGDDQSTATSPTTTTPTTTTITYTGTLEVGGSRFYSFTHAAAGSVTAFLASVTTPDSRVPLATPLELGIGVPAGTDCAATTAQVVTPGLVAQLNVSLAAGVFCLRVADTGQIKSPVAFAVRFTHP